MGLLRFPDPLWCRRRKVTAIREEGGKGGRKRKRRQQLGGLLCLLITRHICIHVRASPRLAALTFSLNVIVCNNLMPPVSLRPLLQQATSPLSLSAPLPSWLLHRRHDCLFWCSIVAVHPDLLGLGRPSMHEVRIYTRHSDCRLPCWERHHVKVLCRDVLNDICILWYSGRSEYL